MDPQTAAPFSNGVLVVHRMWTEEYPVFHGKHYMIDKPINEPKGVQKPHIPLWIGGSGEKVTLKLVAKWGNACNVGGDPDTLRHKFEVLRGHCEQLGRNYDEIVRSTGISVFLLDSSDDPARATASLWVTRPARRGFPWRRGAGRPGLPPGTSRAAPHRPAARAVRSLTFRLH